MISRQVKQVQFYFPGEKNLLFIQYSYLPDGKQPTDSEISVVIDNKSKTMNFPMNEYNIGNIFKF